MISRLHFIYKTTCKITGCYYIGLHSTIKLHDDRYLGSGKQLQNSIQVYGRANHEIEILACALNRKFLIQLERDFIGDLWKTDELCLNSRPGGVGGWETVNDTPALKAYARRRSAEAQNVLFRTNENFRLKKQKQGRDTLGKIRPRNTFHQGFLGRHHTSEAIDKMKAKRSGSNNPQYGKVWIYSDLLKKSVRISRELVTNLDGDWKPGRKMNYGS